MVEKPLDITLEKAGLFIRATRGNNVKLAGIFQKTGNENGGSCNLTSDWWDISVKGETDSEPETVVSGEHFWHASCSMDGELSELQRRES